MNGYSVIVFSIHTELSGHIIKADVIVAGRVWIIWVASKKLVTEQTQALLFSANHFLGLFSVFSFLQEDNGFENKYNIPLKTQTYQEVSIVL